MPLPIEGEVLAVGDGQYEDPGPEWTVVGGRVLAPGVYFLKMDDPAGQRQAVRVVVIR